MFTYLPNNNLTRHNNILFNIYVMVYIKKMQTCPNISGQSLNEIIT